MSEFGISTGLIKAIRSYHEGRRVRAQVSYSMSGLLVCGIGSVFVVYGGRPAEEQRTSNHVCR